ncbi:site-specific integrase [Flavobacteriaceae bacterium]|nr:site-specific integrase [Flavobacteriaceae bacterium]
MKWSNALKDFALYLKIERGMSMHTVNNYTFDVQKLVVYLETHDMHLTPLQVTTDL